MRILLTALLLTGCAGSCDQQRAHWMGYTERCVDGVDYLIFPKAVTVKYTRAGAIATCGEDEP